MAAEPRSRLAVGPRRLVVGRRDGQGVVLQLDGRRLGRVSVQDTKNGSARLVLECDPRVAIARDEYAEALR